MLGQGQNIDQKILKQSFIINYALKHHSKKTLKLIINAKVCLKHEFLFLFLLGSSSFFTLRAESLSIFLFPTYLGRSKGTLLAGYLF